VPLSSNQPTSLSGSRSLIPESHGSVYLPFEFTSLKCCVEMLCDVLVHFVVELYVAYFHLSWEQI